MEILYLKKIMFVFGTRPEAIKLAPIILKVKSSSNLRPIICVTGQHREMLDQVLDIFSIKPDYDLNIMKANQTLFDISIDILQSIKSVMETVLPDILVIQGDTTTTFIASLAAYYLKIPIAHVEAGLRSFKKYSPFPEEINRKLTTHLADLHFVPTEISFNNLTNEGIDKNRIFITGNSVVDSLNFISQQIGFKKSDKPKKHIILVTGHRRENFGEKFEQLCYALKEIAQKFPSVQIIYPVHLNPNVQKPVYDILTGTSNIELLPPISYIDFIKLMHKSYLILSDSGGIQEEAPTFQIPVLVMRDTTERPEGIKAGIAKLVGTNKEIIVKEVSELLTNQDYYRSMTSGSNPYGDGNTSARIVKIIEDFIN